MKRIDEAAASPPPRLDPDHWFSPPPGISGHLVDRSALRTWLCQVADITANAAMLTLGESTEGRPLDLLAIGNVLLEHSLDDLAARRRRELDTMLTGASGPPATPPIVLITSGIHATEVGGPQSLPALVWWLLTHEEAAAVRKDLLTLIVPTLNPDGFDLVTRWHAQTAGTDQAGTNPPLLYHRFAGHDNNRDWLYRNLIETRVVMDRVHAVWWPHVTLDQHQMNASGPRFVLPPYADPWEPGIHPHIIAGSNALGSAVAADMTLAGLRGVVTGRYFDAWEPSRALQHYRGGIRVLAEAASAALADDMIVAPADLAADPLPQPVTPGADCPAPWPGGRWGLEQIVEYHVTAATSLLRRVAAEPDRWRDIQRAALAPRQGATARFALPQGSGAIDRAANQRLAAILRSAGAIAAPGSPATFDTSQPLGPLVDALLRPKAYPEAHGDTAYDVTTHHLPLIMGATVQVGTRERQDPSPTETDRYALIDARTHAAPEVIEPVLHADPPRAWRSQARSVTDGHLIEAGTWIVDQEGHPSLDRVAALAHGSVSLLPGNAVPVSRRHVVVLDIADSQPEDLGWTRWWLQARGIPFLECSARRGPNLATIASTAVVIVPDTARVEITTEAVEVVAGLLDAGARVIAFGASGRCLAQQLVTGVGVPDLGRRQPFRAPGALLRLVPRPGAALAAGIDRAVPAMFQRDGVFAVSRVARDVRVTARFAARDTVLGGWISSEEPLRNAPAIIEAQVGNGTLHAFAFRPFFRGQTLVTAPLVHNLLYAPEES